MHIRDLTNINEVEGKTASFAFGRMNPPTIGHKKLADAVLAQAGDPYIFLSQSQKPQTDPLDFVTKLALARKFFPGVSVGDPSVKTIIQALTKLDSLGYDNVIYVAGSDRIQDFTELLNKYNGKADKQGNIAYTFKDIQVVSAGERDPDAEGAEGMSASKMRAAAAKGDFEAFKSGTPEPKLAQTMYDRVRAGMGIKEEAPPGREKQVKALKGEVDNPYAVAWASYNKSKNKTNESVNLEDRMVKVIETLQDLHRAKPLDEATTQYVLKQVTTIREHLNNINEATLDLPDLESGDELMVGKFKNRRATIKDFKKDEHGQPVAVTNKGDQKIFKGRVKKLMPTEGKRIPRKKGQKAGSKKHSDLYTDENPKGTIQGLKFATVKDAEASVSKIRNSGKKHAHKIQAAIAMEQRAKAADKKTAAAVYRSYINSMKKKTKKMDEDALNEKCWDGYKQVGMKKKGKRKVPNCVPKSKTSEGKSPHKPGTEKYRKHMAAIHASAEPKGTMIERNTAQKALAGAKAQALATGGDTFGGSKTQEFGQNSTSTQKVVKKLQKKASGVAPAKPDIKGVMNQPGAKDFNEGISYDDPQFDVEWEEANRYPYLEKLGPEGWEELAKTGRAVRVTKDSVKNIGNTGADGSESLDDLEPEKVARLKQAMDSGTVEMPIVVKQPDGSLELIAGNTRLIGLISTQGEAQVWLVDASKKVELDEMTLARLKGKIFGKIMSRDKKEKLRQMIKDKGISTVSKMFGISNRELEELAGGQFAVEVKEGVGRIVKGVNTTQDVGVNQTKIEAAKLGSKVDKDGRPPLLHTKVAEGRLSKDNKSHGVVIKFVNHCKKKLQLPSIPTITLVDRIGDQTFGQYNTLKKDITIQLADRHIVDVLRTLAHELVHYKQGHMNPAAELDGRDGSEHENQANALAGKLMRQFGKRYPKLYENLQERVSIGVPLSSGLIVNIHPRRELKIKKSTKGRLNYENPRANRKSKTNRGATV